MSQKITTSALVALALLAAGPSGADGIYYGVGLGYGSAKSGTGTFGPESSKADLGLMGLTLGYRFDRPKMFFAGELDSDLHLSGTFHDTVTGNTCAAGANGPYYCSHDATVRLRGLVGAPMANGYDVFGSLGLVHVIGTSATDTFTHANVGSNGFTVGFGIQHKMQGRGVARFELIYDQANASNGPGGYTPKYNAVTLKATWLF